MHFFLFLAAYLLVIRLRKEVKFMPAYAKWQGLLYTFSWIIIAAFLLTCAINPDWLKLLAGIAVLGGLAYYLVKEPDFKPYHAIINAHYPLIAVGFITVAVILIAPKFYHEYDDTFGVVGLIAWLWIFARWAGSKKQLEQLRQANIRNNELDTLVAERTAELTKQTAELQQTIELLKATQAQLIQQEKLASLGELTAGIAHEIQNPLNFVNNFSEVSMELIDEMQEELSKGDAEEAGFIANDIKQNLEKIIHHGKRADGIVKGMLQHSRASSDTKEPTNLNGLADEYLRLAYHGLRAKDKSFNATLISNFDDQLPPVTVVPQDVGRVLLNLFTNAFYAVHQKQKTAGTDYKPTVEVTTSHAGKSAIITVKDNGTGIPDEIRDKIMQPFFTTKPTGEGTGLGLSLSYDIIVKLHGGKIDVSSQIGEFTQFTITIPINSK